MTLNFKFTESSKGFERKPFRVLLIIMNNWFFKNTHESLLSEQVLKSPSENIAKIRKVHKVRQNV